jgi:hypothetical protein
LAKHDHRLFVVVVVVLGAGLAVLLLTFLFVGDCSFELLLHLDIYGRTDDGGPQQQQQQQQQQ